MRWRPYPGDTSERERIFERFARAGLHRRKTEGAGLGLAIVRAIVTAHGGTVELALADPRRRGATFTITIPTDPPEEPGAP
ncbi:MAG: ATP-binding protein [Solirubrobacteraceae bacterium]